MSNGETQSYVQSKLNEEVLKLDNFKTSLGLGTLSYNAEVDNILNLRRDQLEGLQPLDCSIYCAVLQQFSLFIQQQLNRVTAEKKWAEHNINVLIAKEHKNFPTYFKQDEKRFLISKANDVAKELNDIILDRQSKIEELNFISTRVSNLATAISDIKYYKVNKK